MAATNKTELLEVSEKEFAKLERLIAAITNEQAIQQDEDATSIKDVVAHRAHWIGLFLGWYSDGQAGKPVYFPAKGYKWNDLKRYNSELRLQQKDMGWDAAVSALQDGNAKLMQFIQSHSNSGLYDGPMQGANNNWTTGRWAEAAGPSHFRSAAKYIRARLRSM
ncbi:ClbS/DfsB family four-helix bundle protein [Ruegeria sp. HKCCD8929]|uniref:ClbS/DfsB family four-helix bundle protein n=1 Tax=Ruegeria sp. HKCCD8929 TaxID=2683006 RepID=UPI001489C37F|nr:ClbS/DfsB family four-helix bundle protein [Ruegeria sp. HKCCD8929]